MSLIVPDSQELEVLIDRLTPNLTMKLYGNDYTPDGFSTASAFTEISGGGYASIPLVFGNWNFTTGDPSTAAYNTAASWVFTGVIDPPGVIYGYFVIRDSDGELMWAERFGSGVVPFSPENGSVIKILPRYSVQSQF